MKEFQSSSISHPNDRQWDDFIASLHGVWEFAPDLSLDGQIGLSGREVLIVGEETFESRRLTNLLEGVGLLPVKAADEEAAETALRSKHYDIIILMVAGISEKSLSCCEAIADSKAGATTSVIVVSDDGATDSIQRWRRAGARYCLRNPVDPYVLVNLIASAVEQNNRHVVT